MRYLLAYLGFAIFMLLGGVAAYYLGDEIHAELKVCPDRPDCVK